MAHLGDGTGTQSLSRGVAIQLCGQPAWLPISEQVEEGTEAEPAIRL